MRDFSLDHSALALNTATLGSNVEGHGAQWSPEKIIEECAERGYGAISWWRRELGHRAQQIGERTRAAGLEVCGLCRAPFLVGPLAAKKNGEILDEFKASLEAAAALQASCLTIVVGGVIEQSHGLSESLKRVEELVIQILPVAEALSVKLALEPLHPVYGGDRSCLVTVRDAVDLCQAIDHPLVTIAVDVYHVWWDLSLADELNRAGGQRIAGYHICDWLPFTEDVLLDRGMMGDGVADLKRIREAVENTGYSGFCEVEIFSKNNWWKRDPGEVLDICVERFKNIC